VLAAVLLGLLAGCGGTSRLSASAYRARLATTAKEADHAQADVEKGLTAKSVPEIQARLRAYATAVDQIGHEVSGLKPPMDAEAANAALARAEHDTAAATRSASSRLAKFTSPKAAIGFLSNNPAGMRAGRELDQALSQLQKLGYTKAS
jgi:hypothetical protein